ncbi:MAG: efflux RND transporter periplasmic adaptor subunit [Bryobacterales bacterium]|nr:efflux RND transporter periplasmic adaptor subunit [Bryobacteraceae bacterium]MDW8355689.1 efflux RND transporter periplasmic adaptor subunit [Bryobacterales bacterium]
MRPLVVLAAAIWSLACSRPEPSGAVAEAKVQPRAPRFVTLSPEAQREAAIAIERVQPAAAPLQLEASGRITVNENRTWRVGAVTEGRIIRVYAAVGDHVEQGQVLARMHSHDIHESRAEYRKAVAEVARLRAVEAYARRARDRARRLYELKAGSLEQAEHAETELRNAQAALANAEADLERVRKHLVEFLQIPAEGPEEPAATHAHREEDLIPIKAPASGTVLARNVTAGAVVSSSTDLFVISDLASLWMIAAVAEEHLSKLREGMSVRVAVQAYPGRWFPAHIGRIAEELDPTTRTVKVRVELPNPAGALKPEMYARAEIVLGRSEPALFVPQEAVQEIEGRPAVFVQTAPNRFEPRWVRTGRTVGRDVEIGSGLRPGEAVVVRGSYILKSELFKATLAEE